jgi:hypothetical protein
VNQELGSCTSEEDVHTRQIKSAKEDIFVESKKYLKNHIFDSKCNRKQFIMPYLTWGLSSTFYKFRAGCQIQFLY